MKPENPNPSKTNQLELKMNDNTNQKGDERIKGNERKKIARSPWGEKTGFLLILYI